MQTTRAQTGVPTPQVRADSARDMRGRAACDRGLPEGSVRHRTGAGGGGSEHGDELNLGVGVTMSEMRGEARRDRAAEMKPSPRLT